MVLAASSSDDSGGSWRAHNMPNRHAINRQVALNTLAAMHRRFSLPGIINTSGRPLAEFRASANKSLDILRQNIQAAVTKDIDQVIKKYLEKFFVPAVNNIRTNLGEESVSEEQLRAVCRAMLDGARTLYAAAPRPSVPIRPAPSPSELSDSESSNGADSRFSRPASSPSFGKRKESDTDSDVGVGARRKRRLEGYAHKWDPARINHDTLFIMGSIANKVLGLGQSRGRLYTKHAGLLRYPADSADKEWITNQNLKTTGGGKTYIMVLEDIEELIVSENYRHSSTLRLSELSCFRAPPFMLRKIQAYIIRRCEMSEGPITSACETPTPPSIVTVPPVINTAPPVIIKEENIEDQNIFDGSHKIKLEIPDDTLVNENNKTIKTEIECNENSQFIPNDHCIKMEQAEEFACGNFDDLNNIPGNFSSIISAGMSSVDNNFWKSIAESHLLNNNPKDVYDSNIKVELNNAADLIDADIEFLSGDFCSYADSEADVKKSFDKISDGNDDIFLGENSNLLNSRLQTSNINHDNSMNLSQALSDELMAKAPIISSLIGNIGVDPTSDVHTYVPTSNSTLIPLNGSSNFQNTLPSTFPLSLETPTFSQTLPSFSQISAPMQAHLITSQATPIIQSTSVPWQTNIDQTTTQTVYSFANATGTMNATITTGSALVGVGNRTSIAGNIFASGGNFINITPKNFSTGNILHNAIVSRNMVNRGLGTSNINKSVQNNINTVVTKTPQTLPSAPSFLRTSATLPSKVDLNDDASITTTKAMIDNTCNSSAMLKQVLTLGSAGVNKTFLSPPTQKLNLVRPTSSASSTLSASHATLSALLSGIDPSHSDKKSSFVLSTGEK